MSSDAARDRAATLIQAEIVEGKAIGGDDWDIATWIVEQLALNPGLLRELAGDGSTSA